MALIEPNNIKNELSEPRVWKIIESFFKKNGLVHQQIESFNYYINTGIQSVIDEESDIEILLEKGKQRFVIHFGQIYITQPSVIEENRNLNYITPKNARNRDLNYDSSICCDITDSLFEDTKLIEENKYSRVCIGRTPIMLRSDKCILTNMTKNERIDAGECENDPGGYFIIKGGERAIISQLRGNYNNVIVLQQKQNEKYSHIAEIRSMSEETGHSVQLKAMIENDDKSITLSLPYVKEFITAGVVFKALGFISDEDIINLIGFGGFEQGEKYIRIILRDSFFIETQDDALSYIGQYSMHIIPKEKRKIYALQVVETELFPHLGISSTVKEKGFFLGHIIKQLISTKIGIRQPDDRDNFSNKRVETTGMLFTELFRSLFKRYINSIKVFFEKKKSRSDILSVISKLNILTQGLKYSCSTGNWGVQKNSYIRTGVSQVLSRMTYGGTLSHLRRLVIPIGKEGKNAKIRQIHTSQFGGVCPAECFDPETPILLWDGNIKKAYEINVGDILINDNGFPTKVKSTCSGYKRMFEIQQENAMNYTVTDNHILTLKIKRPTKIVTKTNTYEVTHINKNTLIYEKKYFNTIKEAEVFILSTEDIIDITIEKYLKLAVNIKKQLYGFKCGGINWSKQEVKSDPYNLGLLLKDKHIPIKYLINDRDTRLKVLASIVDTNESNKEFDDKICLCKTGKNTQLIYDALFLGRSLGFSCHINDYDELIIKGEYIYEIPSKKKINFPKKIKLLTSINVIEKKIGPFVGWQLEGNGRFLLADFTTVHNTPEGASAGIVLNFSLLAKVSKKIPTVLVKEILEQNENIISINNTQLNMIPDLVKVFLNGIIVGMTKNPDILLNNIKEIRRSGRIDKDVSVSYDVLDCMINVFCDAGRIIRPFFTVGPEGLNIEKINEENWDKLVKQNCIEFLDNSEIENNIIAMFPYLIKKFTHEYCEIHPSMLLGVMGNIIPFPDHSPSPRNCYQCSMGKQALGIHALSYKSRTDTITHVLDYIQKPIVSTRASKFMGFDDMPSGINAIVAILAYTGYNQEDSVIMNKAFTERGGFSVTSYRTVSEEEKKGGMYMSEIIGVPPESSVGIKPDQPGFFKRKNGNYSLLDERGIIKKGINIKKGDLIIGKILTKTSKSGEEKKTDCSISIKQGEEGIVDSIYVSTTPHGYKMVKIVIRQQRYPEIGDKVASRAAQKGTIGAIYNQEDMPFNLEGISPDIIINPHCIPSRMTTNQLMECVLGKACSISGTYGDATPWSSSSTDNAAEKICELLAAAGMQEQQGYNRTGWETLTNGFTGEQIKAKVFMGPTYYQRLKHMVKDKIHARSQGHVTTLTRQPLEGRSRDGGLRFGEMERDCMIAHGASRFLKERLFDCSDPYQIIVCDHCGMITTNKNECTACKKDNVTTCNIPYAAKLLIQELMAMSIKVAINPLK